jgi:hypothetical protein
MGFGAEFRRVSRGLSVAGTCRWFAVLAEKCLRINELLEKVRVLTPLPAVIA